MLKESQVIDYVVAMDSTDIDPVGHYSHTMFKFLTVKGLEEYQGFSRAQKARISKLTGFGKYDLTVLSVLQNLYKLISELGVTVPATHSAKYKAILQIRAYLDIMEDAWEFNFEDEYESLREDVMTKYKWGKEY